MKNTIGKISKIRFGLYAQPEETGELPYLQIRQFNEMGLLDEKQANEYVNIGNKTEMQQLNDGDVLFVAKGNRLFAWCYRNYLGPYVASSVFFVLKPDLEKVYPEYLAAVLNTSVSKKALLQIGGGTNIFSIRKSELEAFEIPLPKMDRQKKIAAIAALQIKEMALTQDLLYKKQELYTGIISKLMN